MEAIELTEEHKSKLLEMCFKLFKKEIHGLTIQDNGFLNYSDTSKTIDYVDRIHWFEFCITHLATNIYNKGKYNFNYITTTQFRGYLCQNNIHLIDCLYEEFKKLKL
jgi:hypothetical protein